MSLQRRDVLQNVYASFVLRKNIWFNVAAACLNEA